MPLFIVNNIDSIIKDASSFISEGETVFTFVLQSDSDHRLLSRGTEFRTYIRTSDLNSLAYSATLSLLKPGQRLSIGCEDLVEKDGFVSFKSISKVR